jgi:tetratricopeptide (TPR) repeat protein
MRTQVLATALLLMMNTAIGQRVISSEEAQAAAKRIETATNSGNPAVLNQFLDLDSLVGIIQQKSQAMRDPEFQAGFVPPFKAGFAKYGQQIVTSIQTGNYRLLRNYEIGGVRHLVFRMFGSGGLNYHDYTLIRIRDSIKSSDVFVYTTDEALSSTLGKMVDMMNNSAEHLPEEVGILMKLNQQLAAKDYTSVKEQYEKLGEKYKQNKAFQLINITACHQLNPRLYETAIEQYASRFPDAPSAYLMMIDLYYSRKEIDKGVAAVDMLDKLIGDDKALDYLRGNFYRLAGKQAESIACYEKVYRYDPTLGMNVHALVAAYEEAGEKEKAKTVITGFKKTNSWRESDFHDLVAKYPDLR